MFQTPTTSTFPSHFQEAFTTPQMPTFATPQQPQYGSSTPVQRPQTSSETLRSNFYANMQASGGQVMQPPGQYSYAALSPVQGVGFHESPRQPMLQSSFHSSQMQTPPPTRGASAKKLQQSSQVAFGTPSTIASRRYITPQQPPSVHNDRSLPQHTSMQFPHLQFSPDVYQAGNVGPASAPVMPQTDIMWASTGGPNGYMQQGALADPFAPSTHHIAQWSPSTVPQSNMQFVPFDTPVTTNFPVHAPHPRPASAVPLGSNAPMLVGNMTGVDPSLVYSSPVQALARPDSRQDHTWAEPDLQARRKDSVNTSHKRSDTSFSADTAPNAATTSAAAGIGLRRSNTTGAGRPKGAQHLRNAPEGLSRTGSLREPPRTASPLKRVGKTPLGSISEARPKTRTSVILTVDENGRARTETRNLDDSPTRSIKERYPGLFDSDSSDDESDTSEQIASRSASFSFAVSDERRAKAARLDPPVENLEGLELPRSGSAASMRGLAPSRAATAAAAQLRRQTTLRKSTPSRGMNKRTSFTRASSAAIDTCPMDMSREQTELSASEQRFGSSSQDSLGASPSTTETLDTHLVVGAGQLRAESTLEAHNRRWTMMSFDQQMQVRAHSMSALLGQSIAQQQTSFRPLATGYYQPQGTPQPPRSPQIRCICGVIDDRGQSLTQCVSCTQWLHSFCIGVDGLVPHGYTCFLCTRPPNQLQ